MSFDPITACKQAGFAEAFLLPNVSYEDWTRHRNDGAFHKNADFVRDDPRVAYPWANACLIAIWPYQPFDDDSVIAPYYLASNTSYHIMQSLIREWNAEGIPCERAETPYRTQLLQAGIGSRMDNQLWYYPPYGTYTVLWGVMLAIEEPVFTESHANKMICNHCGACTRICYGALQNGEYDWKKCIRAYLENEPLPDRFLPELNCFSGCQRCQDVCPMNPKERAPVPDAVRAALDPVEILKGNIRPALDLIGNNRKKQLIRQAIVLAANRHRKDALPYLYTIGAQQGELYKTELQYAFHLLQNSESMIE